MPSSSGLGGRPAAVAGLFLFSSVLDKFTCLTNDDARFDVLTSFLFPSSFYSSSLFKYIVNAYTNVTQLVGNKLMDLFRSSHIFSR